MHPQRCVIVAADPRHLHAYQREVCYIERIGDLSKEPAYFRTDRAGGDAAGSDKHDSREDYYDGDGLIDPVRKTLPASDARNGEYSSQYERGPPEASFYMQRTAARIFRTHPSAEQSRYEQSADERIEQPCESYEYLRPLQAPASDYIVLRVTIEYAEDIPPQSEVHRQEGTAQT